MDNNPFATSSPPPVFGEQTPAYSPPNTGAWQRNDSVPLEDDEPFTAAHLAAANEAVVPAVSGRSAAAPSHTTLDFTESTTALPSSQSLSGKVGQPASPVPRIGSAADTRLLSSSPGPSARLDGGSGGGSGLPGGNAGGAAGRALEEDPSKFAFYNIKRYRGLFNVDTSDVLARLMHAVLLFFRGDFLEYVDGNPDLYGPFWVASTLIFVTAATGTLASYIDWVRHATPGEEHGSWTYDVDKVGGSFALFYGYVGLVGLALWGVLKWFKAGLSLASIWCIYGYSVAAFIPICFVCVVPVEIARWAVVAAATLTSGTFILLSMRKHIQDSDAGAKALPLYGTIIALHAGLGLALKFYFFAFPTL
ncbi:hypothetical protein D9Q98_002017 [Chlorella vulgaris]|uniref:Protein YIP n=1 Tax=Chlorella vulgaris TaxID=3077 RepID=A0A9D4YZV6_CHLVU|nr:hypothetical protein D9Q98_002017 [Chlorella vulgaris]